MGSHDIQAARRVEVKITVVISICHALNGVPAVCHEEIVAETDSIQSCMIGLPAIADWNC